MTQFINHSRRNLAVHFEDEQKFTANDAVRKIILIDANYFVKQNQTPIDEVAKFKIGNNVGVVPIHHSGELITTPSSLKKTGKQQRITPSSSQELRDLNQLIMQFARLAGQRELKLRQRNPIELNQHDEYKNAITFMTTLYDKVAVIASVPEKELPVLLKNVFGSLYNSTIGHRGFKAFRVNYEHKLIAY